MPSARSTAATFPVNVTNNFLARRMSDVPLMAWEPSCGAVKLDRDLQNESISALWLQQRQITSNLPQERAHRCTGSGDNVDGRKRRHGEVDTTNCRRSKRRMEVVERER